MSHNRINIRYLLTTGFCVSKSRSSKLRTPADVATSAVCGLAQKMYDIISVYNAYLQRIANISLWIHLS